MIVIDNFLEEDLDLALEEALCGDYQPYEDEGVEYPGICPASLAIESAVKSRIEDIAGHKMVANKTFFRLTTEGDRIPHGVHSDESCGDITCVLYLNQEGECGTEFLSHQPTGATMNVGAPVHDDLENPSAWSVVDRAEGCLGRASIFDSRQFHAQYPKEGYGDSPSNGRLVLVSFLSRPKAYCRPAILEDVERITEITGLFHQNSLTEYGLTFAPTAFAARIGNEIVNNDNSICYVAVLNDEVVGYCAGTISSNWLDPKQSMFLEQGWFMHPDARNNRLGIKVLKAVLAEAESRAELVTFTLMSNSPDGAAKVLKREGFSPLESYYIKRTK